MATIYNRTYTPVFNPYAQSDYANIKFFNAFGDGVHLDDAAFSLAFSQIPSGGCLFLPQGIYLISKSLYFPGNISIRGVGNTSNGSIIKVKSGTNLTTPVLADSGWNSNNTFSSNPVEMSDFAIDCSAGSATSGTSAHGLVIMNYWSHFRNISVISPTGHGVMLTGKNKAGTTLGNTCVENKFYSMQVRSAGQHGIYVQDSGNVCTDWFIEDCIIASATLDGVRTEQSSGGKFQGNHQYGAGNNGFYIDRCYGTRCTDNYSEGYSGTGRTFDAGLYMGILDGRGSSCIGNKVGFESSLGTSIQGVTLTGRGSAPAIVDSIGNTVNGGNQSGSIGFVYQSQGTQIGNLYTVYDRDNDAMNVPTTVYTDSNTTMGTLKVYGGIAPQVSGFTAFGTGGTVNTLNGSSGTSTTMVAGTIYWAAVMIPYNCTLTGIIFSTGLGAGTDKWIGALYNSAGTLLANSALAGISVTASTNTKQKFAFTGTVNVTGPAVYYIALQSNGTTAKYMSFINATEGFTTGSVAGTFGTLPGITPGNTYTQNQGPFASTY